MTLALKGGKRLTQRNDLESEVYVGRFNAFGNSFERIEILGTQGFLGMVSFGSTINPDALLKQLKTLGYSLKIGDTMAGQISGKSYEARIKTPDEAIAIFVTAGQFDFGLVSKGASGTNAGSGTSLVCAVTSLGDDEARPTEKEIASVLEKQEKMPKEWVDKVIETKSQSKLGYIARYAYLDDEQVALLLQSKVAREHIVQSILANKTVKLSAAQLETLVLSKDEPVLQSLLLTRFNELTPSQITTLKSSPFPLVRRTAVLRSGDGQALSLMAQIIQTEPDSAISSALRVLPALTSGLVELLINHRSVEVRRNFTMNHFFTPTAAQIEKILNDPDHQVQVGLLRRKDMIFSDAQIARKINDPDEHIAFWYRSLAGIRTPDQIEKGLTSDNVVTRRGWAFEDKFTPAQAQINRGLKDPDSIVRSAFIQRKDVVLSPDQFDGCTIDIDFSVRDRCIRRADYALTQWRFERILLDKNPNIPATLLRKSTAGAAYLKPFIDMAIQNSEEAVLLKLAENRDILLSDSHIRKGLESPSRAVRMAFCKRTGGTVCN